MDDFCCDRVHSSAVYYKREWEKARLETLKVFGSCFQGSILKVAWFSGGWVNWGKNWTWRKDAELVGEQWLELLISWWYTNHFCWTLVFLLLCFRQITSPRLKQPCSWTGWDWNHNPWCGCPCCIGWLLQKLPNTKRSVTSARSAPLLDSGTN